MSTNDTRLIDTAAGLAQKVLATLDDTVLGQREAAQTLLACYLAGGHALLEGVPGIGKTLLARSFASSLGVAFSRIQFTPDLMPADIIGTNVFQAATGDFRLVKGPVFTSILMADEINRTPPKTQSALLEAMQEGQATIDGMVHPLNRDFFVVATQNPVEFEGTYPLPEAQLDRFSVRVEMRLPTRDTEHTMLKRATANGLVGWDPGAALPAAVLDPDQAHLLRTASRSVHVDDKLLDYLLNLVTAIRSSPLVELPISPRGVLALNEVSRATALIEGRDYVTPDDVRRMLVPCWGHRLLLTAEAELEQHTSRLVLEKVSASVEVPH